LLPEPFSRLNLGEVAMTRYSALYTRRLTQKSKNFIDGFIEITPSPDSSQIRVKLLDESDSILASASLQTPPPLDGDSFMLGGFLVQIDAPISESPPPPRATLAARPAPFRARTIAPKPIEIKQTNVVRATARRERQRTFDEIVEFFLPTADAGTHDAGTIQANLARLFD
jgi:hypothetical protein